MSALSRCLMRPSLRPVVPRSRRLPLLSPSPAVQNLLGFNPLQPRLWRVFLKELQLRLRLVLHLPQRLHKSLLRLALRLALRLPLPQRYKNKALLQLLKL